jgi:dienelactone hydrolase
LASRTVTEGPVVTVSTRHGPVPARSYRPGGAVRRTTLLVPGVHKDGLHEERLVGLARELAATGMQVLVVAPPDLTRYRVTTDSVDELEDIIAWASRQPELAADGKVGIIAFSFSGGMALVAAGRPKVRDQVAFAFSFGGHGDLPRVLRYLCGVSPDPLPSPSDAGALAYGGEHIHVPKPHDYGAVVTLLNLADQAVPSTQVEALQDAITRFLRASSLERLNPREAAAQFAQARALGQDMPEPSRTLMRYVSDRNVSKLGEVMLPLLTDVDLPAALSPERSPAPSAPVFLLHGADDSVVPASEMLSLARKLGTATKVRAFASRLITHAETGRRAALAEMWTLSSFWQDLLSR